MDEYKENALFFGLTEECEYPTSEQSFGPSEFYPEYLFDKTTLSVKNQVYSLIRESFYKLEYDAKNYNTKDWNPLGEFVNRNQTVVIKPNWVMHYNKNKSDRNNLDCLVTHPSLVRAVIDYALIALKGNGKIIIADAPMQGCDLNEMFRRHGYYELFRFYENQGINIQVIDLRKSRVIVANRVITKTVEINGDDQSIQVQLGKSSAHRSNSDTKYKVSDYLAENTNKYHNNDYHCYSINKIILEADFIINMPKPKTHRLAGITAAQKNIVGIVFDKSCLPHRVIGAKLEGGDEYYKPSKTKSLLSNVEEKKLDFANRKNIILSNILQYFIYFLYVFIRLYSKDKVTLGSWYGNDTIWRTVTDLNLIIRYSDTKGIMQKSPQRRILNIADMIISGQGNGPIAPHPKNIGGILVCEDLTFMDSFCSKIMGFDINKIPGLKNSLDNEMLCFKGNKTILSNKNYYNKIPYNDFIANLNWRFEAHKDWKGFIEIL